LIDHSGAHAGEYVHGYLTQRSTAPRQYDPATGSVQVECIVQGGDHHALRAGFALQTPLRCSPIQFADIAGANAMHDDGTHPRAS